MTNEITSLDDLIVVKMGTDSITKKGKLDQRVVANIAEEIAHLMCDLQKKVILVASGAVGAGLGSIPEDKREQVKQYRQALSTLGQPELDAAIKYHFQHHGIRCAQGLSEEHHFETSDGRENMKKVYYDLHSIQEVIRQPILLLLNTNDFVTSEGFTTDNDALAGSVLSTFEAGRKRLVILSKEEGLLANFPAQESVVRRVNAGIDEWSHFVQRGTSENGSGGWRSKGRVLENAAENGHFSFTGNGKRERIIHDVLDLRRGTVFVPPEHHDKDDDSLREITYP